MKIYLVEYNTEFSVPNECKFENAGLGYGAGGNTCEYFENETEAREFYAGINLDGCYRSCGGYYTMGAKEISYRECPDFDNDGDQFDSLEEQFCYDGDADTIVLDGEYSI